jgi:hypothetical protein
MFINSQTHLPIMVSWTVPATAARIVMALPGQPPPKDPAPGAIVVEAPPPGRHRAKGRAGQMCEGRAGAPRELASAKPIEHRIYYMDYRTRAMA